MNKKILTLAIIGILLSFSFITFSLASDKVIVGAADIVQRGDYTQIRIPVSGKVKYKTKKLEDPVRLVVDLLNANYEGEMQNKEEKIGVLRSVRMNQFRQKPIPVTRGVVELSDSAPFIISKENSDLVINLANKLSEREAEKYQSMAKAPEGADTAIERESNEVYAIEVKTEDNKDKIYIKTKMPASYSLLEMEKNKILVLDIPDAIHNVPESVISVDQGVVKEIRSSQFQEKPFETVRVAVGLKEMVPYHVEKTKGGIVVTLDNPLPKKKETLMAQAPKASSSVSPAAADGSDEASLIDSLGILLGKGVGKEGSAAESPSYTSSSGSPSYASRSRYSDQLQSDWEEGLITLDFKDVEITNVLRMLSYKRNLNIIAGNDVQGKVTVRLLRVPWEQALRMILQINGFDYEKRDDIIWVTSQANLATEKVKREEEAKVIKTEFIKIMNADAEYVSGVVTAFLTEGVGSDVIDKRSNTIIITDLDTNLPRIKDYIKKIDVEKATKYVAPLQTRIYVLNYAKAKDIEPTIKSMLTKEGVIKTDTRTNALIVTDAEMQHNIIEGIIAELDSKTPQVMIESKVVDITLSKQKQLGIKWALGNKEQSGTAINDQPNTDTRITGSVASEVTKTGYLTVGTLLDTAVLDAAISAHSSDSDINLLANPKIATLDNEEATIMIGSKVPILTLDEQGNPKTELVDIGIKLQVTPHITNDGYVTMNVHPEVSKLADSPGTGAQIQIDISEVRTNIMVKDDQTAVIGGLLRMDKTDVKTGIPYLSQVPLLGYLFRGNTKRNDSRELLIFITPHIVRDFSHEKTTYNKVLDRFGDSGAILVPDDNATEQ